MNNTDILIIGCGAAGLTAAQALVKAGKKVTILEARSRPGGRIHTFTPEGFSSPVEAGGEFIHGDSSLTISILKKAGIPYYSMEGKSYRIKKNKLMESDEFIENMPELLSAAGKLKKDIPFKEFLNKYFEDNKYESLKESAVRFAEGYDAADIKKASTFALAEEWKSSASATPYRVENGYSSLVRYLVNRIEASGAEIKYSAIVKEIKWKRNLVEVVTSNGAHFNADKVLITVPLGVLKADQRSEAHINFTPGIPDISAALNKIGFGLVMKIFFEFNEAFWDNTGSAGNPRQMNDAGFIISDSPFTAWWSQLPDKTPILTGWFAGPEAYRNINIRKNDLLDKARESLCYIFNVSPSFLKQKIKAEEAFNWGEDPFSLGAYSFATVESAEAIELLSEPVEDTLFFAGEALSDPGNMGTVESALASGIKAAEILLKD